MIVCGRFEIFYRSFIHMSVLLCLFQARTFITNSIGRGFPCRVQSVMVRSRCSLVLILMNFFLLSLFKFSFHNHLFPVYGEVYSIQHYVIKFVSDLRQVGGFSHGPSVSSTSKIPLYNLNIVESGAKHHKPNNQPV